jgi:hypothetical protein
MNGNLHPKKQDINKYNKIALDKSNKYKWQLTS